jgi:hypothetical protein
VSVVAGDPHAARIAHEEATMSLPGLPPLGSPIGNPLDLGGDDAEGVETEIDDGDE